MISRAVICQADAFDAQFNSPLFIDDHKRPYKVSLLRFSVSIAWSRQPKIFMENLLRSTFLISTPLKGCDIGHGVDFEEFQRGASVLGQEQGAPALDQLNLMKVPSHRAPAGWSGHIVKSTVFLHCL